MVDTSQEGQGREARSKDGEDSPAGSIDVVIPVYNAPDDLARCVESVLAQTKCPYRLVLIDDASPDSAIGRYFAELERRGLTHVVLLRNAENLGFTATANRGMTLSRADVVLLNSDTIVTSDWLDALLRCAASEPRIGTATPFSNNAGICSFPRFCVSAVWPESLDPEPVRLALEQAAVPTYPDLPTGVGFCLFVRRTLIDAIGTFDMAFGKGYGEENDFSMRAVGAGFRNVLCDDAFVLHVGGRSFGDRQAELRPPNMSRLHERHPGYFDIVRTFIDADPLRPIRDAALARARVTRGRSGVLHVVQGSSSTPGRHVRGLIDISRRRYRHYLASVSGDSWTVEESLGRDGLRRYEFRRDADEPWLDFLGGMCATFGIDLIHLHTVLGSPHDVLATLADLQIPYGYTAHDMEIACPTVNLVEGDGRYCGAQTDASVCRRCLDAQQQFRNVDIVAWRARHAALLDSAAFITAPSRWAAHVLARYFRGHQIEMIPHAAPFGQAMCPPTLRGEGATGAITGIAALQDGGTPAAAGWSDDARMPDTTAVYDAALASVARAGRTPRRPFTPTRVRDALGYVPWTMLTRA